MQKLAMKLPRNCIETNRLKQVLEKNRKASGPRNRFLEQFSEQRQKSYLVGELELLALVWGLWKLNHSFHGKKVINKQTTKH